MKPRDIDRFFSLLANDIKTPLRILLTGGAAAILQGAQRATEDIDFEVSDISDRDAFDRALESVAKKTGIQPQYSEDIDRWSMIVLPTKKSLPYKKFGRIEVRILEPRLWALGKLTRFLGSDETDLVSVLKHARLKPHDCVKLWGEALGMSPASTAQKQFYRHVEFFLKKYAPTIWGPKTNVEKHLAVFRQRAEKLRRRKRL